MPALYEVEIEPEIRSWLASLPDRDFGRADFLVDLLGGKVRELRFHLLCQQTRVT
jgi:hypothetical protein